jgi:hypothetical protein
MSIERGTRLWRAARTAYSRPAAVKSHRAWHDLAGVHAADMLLLPLTLLMLTLFLFGSVPGASDAISKACSIACFP